MSSNFYIRGPKGGMAGLDPHPFITYGPEGEPQEVPCYPHAVLAPLMFPDAHTTNVSADGYGVWQRGGSTMSSHIPLPALPPCLVEEAACLALICNFSSSKATLAVSSVTGNGAPLACCIVASLSVNLNCGDTAPLRLNNLVLCVASVKTSPTLGDYLRALASIAFGMLFSWIFGLLFDRLFSKLLEKLGKLAAPYIERLLRTLLRLLEKLGIPKLLDPILKALRKTPADKIWQRVEKAIEKTAEKIAERLLEEAKKHTPLEGIL